MGTYNQLLDSSCRSKQIEMKVLDDVILTRKYNHVLVKKSFFAFETGHFGFLFYPEMKKKRSKDVNAWKNIERSSSFDNNC